MPEGFPIFPNLYTGDAEEYLVTNYTVLPVLHAGDRPGAARYLIQVHYLLPHKKDPAPALDARGLLAMPAAIDAHVHFRQPGAEEAETVATGLAAAARGGVGTVLAMPNTTPPLDTPEAIRAQAAEQTQRIEEIGVLLAKNTLAAQELRVDRRERHRCLHHRQQGRACESRALRGE